uniref:Ankyrin repeat domain-containing protein n=2 Tax=Alexandrium monilatum TaxID=311494 RepID=A0A7S4Q850_9DINO|mmetsp:Transcript_87854/g.277754  ORF Transcript_87854/g.277754 Transcript_87854/m.277754 type:complete len:247 (-) Transcript_87854:40-780(-)
MNLPGIVQEPRIRSIVPDPERWTASACPSPLPAAIYSRIDDWGVTGPMVPMDAERLVLLHSDPALWPQLDEVRRMATGFPADGRLMVYMEARQGRRVLGPHFEGRSDLSVCAYRRRERLGGFAAAANRLPDAREALPELATLHWAAWHGRPEVVPSLCAAGADVNEMRVRAPVQEEFAPLHIAAIRGHIAMVEELLAMRADAGRRATLSGATPLDAAAMVGRVADAVSRRLQLALAQAANVTGRRQ